MDVPILDVDPVNSIAWDDNLSDFGRSEMLPSILLFLDHFLVELRLQFYILLLHLVLGALIISRWWCLVLACSISVILVSLSLTLGGLFVD